MKWILSNSQDIIINNEQVQARRNYIRRVTNAEVSAWNYMCINGQFSTKFLCCNSHDGIDGIFITAHFGEVIGLSDLREVCNSGFVVANTCIWEKMSDKKLLNKLRFYNRNVELWFAQQEMSVDANRVFRQSTTLNNFGQFGFQTSLSEREMFIHRKKGFLEAMRVAFVRVSPILLS